MIKKVSRNEMRVERHNRIRKDLAGTTDRPRLNVFRSNANITAQIKKEKKYIGKGYKNRNNIHWLDLAEAGIDTELFRWSLVDNGTNIRYEWWEDDGGALIDHTTSVSIEIPNALGELISPEPVEVNVKIGKKDDYAGSVYAYYIDENNHIYNTSYVMFEIEYRKQ